MIDLFKNFILLLLTPECYDQYFVNFNFFHGECMKATLSKVVGWTIIAGSTTVKVPQIMKIINNKSGEGISTIGTLLELFTMTSLLLYTYLKQFPFSTWGEGFFLVVQTIVVLSLIFLYKSQHLHFVLFLSIFSITSGLFLSGVIPFSVLWMLQMLNVPILIVAKGVQALSNYRNKGTGQLSGVTLLLQFGGATARVFTSIQDMGDPTMIFTFVICSILNGIILFQYFYYAKPSKKKGKSKGKKSE